MALTEGATVSVSFSIEFIFVGELIGRDYRYFLNEACVKRFTLSRVNTGGKSGNLLAKLLTLFKSRRPLGGVIHLLKICFN